MNIRFLETAVQLARNHSFRLTAEVLNITQAAVSSRVAAMEQELGVRLFDRQSRDLAMTKEGEEFIRGARAIIDQYETLVTSLRPTPQIKGLVRLGLVPSMAQILLPDIVRTLRENYPAVSFELTTDSHGTLAQLLEDNKLDVCLTIAPETASERQEVCQLLTLGMFWIASPTLIPYSTDRLGMSDLARFPIISYASGSLNSKRMTSYLGEDFSADHIVHASNSLATSIHMTVNGIGIMVAPAVVIQRELREGLLHVLNVDPAFTSTDYAIIYSRAHDTRNAIQIASIAREAAQRLCRRFDPSLAALPLLSPVVLKPNAS